MDIFQFALEKERLAKNYYLELKEKAQSPGLKHIFEMLSEEEDKHTQAIKQMQANEQHEVTDSPVLKDAKGVFDKMRDAAEKFNLNVSELELYEKAREIEKHAMDFYLAKAKEVDIDWQKDIFNKLAGEEKKHYVLMDNICELVSHPDTWLEDAEFFHMERF